MQVSVLEQLALHAALFAINGSKIIRNKEQNINTEDMEGHNIIQFINHISMIGNRKERCIKYSTNLCFWEKSAAVSEDSASQK